MYSVKKILSLATQHIGICYGNFVLQHVISLEKKIFGKRKIDNIDLCFSLKGNADNFIISLSKLFSVKLVKNKIQNFAFTNEYGFNFNECDLQFYDVSKDKFGCGITIIINRDIPKFPLNIDRIWCKYFQDSNEFHFPHNQSVMKNIEKKIAYLDLSCTHNHKLFYEKLYILLKDGWKILCDYKYEEFSNWMKDNDIKIQEGFNCSDDDEKYVYYINDDEKIKFFFDKNSNNYSNTNIPIINEANISSVIKSENIIINDENVTPTINYDELLEVNELMTSIFDAGLESFKQKFSNTVNNNEQYVRIYQQGLDNYRKKFILLLPK